MDFLTLLGILVGLAAIVGGNILEGGHTDSLMQLTAFVIVFGGTCGAVLVQTPQHVFMHALRRVRWILFPPRDDGGAAISKLVSWSQVARKEGLLSLQNASDEEKDSFLASGLQMLADGNEPEAIRAALEVEMSIMESLDLGAAKVWEGFGGYSPTIGIIGAVMGLIHVMNNLSDPSALGPGIAVAFVATIYGVGLANLLFLPTANKLKIIIKERMQYRELLVDGLVYIAEGDSPRSIETKLQGYLR
ncbi:MAG: flagellar motor protein [Halieaceae bacterium]|nr:flagellar motor protein [Halieaceae bacterium]